MSDETTGGGGAQGQDLRQQAKAAHGFDAWPGRDGAAVVRGFVPEPSALEGYRFEQRHAVPGSLLVYIDHLTVEGGSGRAAVRVAEYATPADAQEGLVDVLATSMAPELPSCASRGMPIGDVCFCGFGDPVGKIFFTRANVLLRVERISDTPFSVASLAAALDRQLVARAR
jgi:hypothetical protein